MHWYLCWQLRNEAGLLLHLVECPPAAAQLPLLASLQLQADLVLVYDGHEWLKMPQNSLDSSVQRATVIER